MTPEELLALFDDFLSHQDYVTLPLAMEKGSTLLGCRGDYRSGGYAGRPRNVFFERKQVEQMRGRLVAELAPKTEDEKQ